MLFTNISDAKQNLFLYNKHFKLALRTYVQVHEQHDKTSSAEIERYYIMPNMQYKEHTIFKV